MRRHTDVRHRRSACAVALSVCVLQTVAIRLAAWTADLCHASWLSLGCSVSVSHRFRSPKVARPLRRSYLNRAADAVLKLKSAQFTLTREGTPAFLDEKNGITFTAAQCSYAAPDRVSCNVKVSQQERDDPAVDARLGSRRHVPEQSAHASIRQGAGGLQRSTASCCSPGPAFPDILRNGVQKAQVVGNEKVRDKSTLHLKGEVRGEKLNPLMGATLKPEADVSRSISGWRNNPPTRCGFTSPRPAATAG